MGSDGNQRVDAPISVGQGKHGAGRVRINVVSQAMRWPDGSLFVIAASDFGSRQNGPRLHSRRSSLARIVEKNIASPETISRHLGTNQRFEKEFKVSEVYRSFFIALDDVTDGRMEKYGLFVDPVGEAKLLYGWDGDGVFVCSEDAQGGALFETHGGMPHLIMEALHHEFGQEIVCEDDPRFWGGETWDEVFRLARQANNG